MESLMRGNADRIRASTRAQRVVRATTVSGVGLVLYSMRLEMWVVVGSLVRKLLAGGRCVVG